MELQFNFSDVTIIESDITDEMIREECISYLLDKASKSKYLKESITIAENEKFTKWILSLSIDEAISLIFESSADKYAARKKAISQGIERAKRILQRKGELKKSGAKYANWMKAKKEAEKSWLPGHKAKTYSKLGKKWFRLSTGKKAAIIGGGAVAAIGLGLAARALYNKYLSKCARQCKDATDKSGCMAKCKAAAKAAAQKSKRK
jgi:hypothetical protein